MQFIISSLFLVIYNFTFVEAKIMFALLLLKASLLHERAKQVSTQKKDDVIIAHWMG